MPLVIQTNVAALQAQKNLDHTSRALRVSYDRLSSGFRINSAADDAAGLAISDNLQAQVRSFTVAERNANDGISMAQTADGALGSMSGILQRMRELAVQGANGSMSSDDRDYLAAEFTNLRSELDRIQQVTKYDGVPLLGGSSNPITLQVGINNSANDQIAVTFGGLSLGGILSSNVTGSDSSASLAAIDQIDSSLKTISTARASYGAVMNRLAETTTTVQTTRTNLAAAESRIRDADVAEESANLAKNQVLTQAGAAVLSQANQLSQLALGLLKG